MQDRAFHKHWQYKIGHIEVICGPMFSGKTEELIRRLRRAQIAKQKVIVFKPQVDNRYDVDNVVSHSKQAIECRAVESVSDISEYLSMKNNQFNVVGIDEAQFFNKSLVPLIEHLANLGIRVLIAGLDQDYLGEPFGLMPQLLAIADQVDKQFAICMSCSMPASKTQRVQKNKTKLKNEDIAAFSKQVMVGATDTYEARCRKCHHKYVEEFEYSNNELNNSSQK